MIGSFSGRISLVPLLFCVMVGGCTVAEVFGKLQTDREVRSVSRGNESITIIDVTPPSDDREAAPRPRPKPVGFTIDPKVLVNLEESEVRDVMGDPAMVREEPPAVIWSYLSGECRLDVYLYESLSTKVLRSLTYVVETSRHNVSPEKHCVQRLN